MAKTYKLVKHRALVLTKPEGDDKATAKEEMYKILNCGESLEAIGKSIGTTRQNVFMQKKRGYMTPHGALMAERSGLYDVDKEKLRPDVTQKDWATLEESL